MFHRYAANIIHPASQKLEISLDMHHYVVAVVVVVLGVVAVVYFQISLKPKKVTPVIINSHIVCARV